MLLFPNAKINLGLRVIEKRTDGYHAIETVFLPVELYDSLEFIELSGSRCTFNMSGLDIGGNPEDNLVLKAWQIMRRNHGIPSVSIHLHKAIPAGAGLGGGSADAAFMLKGLNDYFTCGCSQTSLEEYALQIGSDCAFFIRNRPALGKGRGEILEDINLSLSQYELLLVNPAIHINTRDAYAGIKPNTPEVSLQKLISMPIGIWQETIVNDFELSVFKSFPAIAGLKNRLLAMGALYASMSGSGSTVYGIFNKGLLNEYAPEFEDYFCYRCRLNVSS
jgi:4-diphosphocytidyl-2-C-methyl-D-erythritol kinase